MLFLGTVALPVLQRLPQRLRGWAEAFSYESQCVCVELDPDGETRSLVALGASGTRLLSAVLLHLS